MTNEEAAMAGSEDDVAMEVVDGNALAGMLAELFGTDMTTMPGRCTHCGTVSLVAEFRAYVRGPGRVLRCPACAGVVLRIVETPDATYVDMRGASYLKLPRS
jgi:phage FluMu protein Com